MADLAGHHGRVDLAEYGEINGLLRGFLIGLDDRLSAKAVVQISEFVDVGELGQVILGHTRISTTLEIYTIN
jgi:hypothetical protein